MTLQEQYSELLKYRKSQPLEVIKNKQRMAWEYFRNLVSVSNLEKNMAKKFTLFYAPVKQIRGTNMTCWSLQDGLTEIYIDENFALNNPRITKIQITHEVLHRLSQIKDGVQFFFGHQYQGDSLSIYYNGIDEATTQLFAEDIEQQRLTEDEDYLYFVKNIMRVMKVAFGVDKLASQYLNNNNQLELYFDKLTEGKFRSFAGMMYDVYVFSKNKYYNGLNNEKMRLLEIRQEQIINFTKMLVDTLSESKPQLKQSISNELQDEIFLNKLGIKTNKIEYANSLYDTSNQSPEAKIAFLK